MIATLPETIELNDLAAVDWLPEELDAWGWQEPMPTAAWVERYVKIPGRGAAVPGPVNLDLTAYLRGLYDAFDDPVIEIITGLFGTQLGKTLFLYTCMMASTVQDPGPLQLVMPTEPDAREVAGNQLREYVSACEPLMDLTEPDRLTREGYWYRSCDWYFGWSNSRASLSRRSIRRMLYDEVEKFPPFVGRESNPLRLGDARLRTFRNTTGAKSVRVSSPTTRDGLIGQSYEASDQRHFWARCPACGAYQVLIWDQVRWPGGEDGHSLEADAVRTQNAAWYACIDCEATWNDAMRMDAVRAGVWAREGERVEAGGQIAGRAKKPHSRHAGFQVSALYSPFVRLSQLAADWIECQGDLAALMAFVCQELGEFWEETENEVKETPLRGHVEAYVMGTAPVGVQAVTCGVDVQRGYFVVETRGWGYGLESWLLDARVIQTDEQLREYLRDMRFARVDDGGQGLDATAQRPLPIHVAAMDAGDQTAYVYDLAQRWREIDLRITMGQDLMSGAMKVRAQPIAKNPRTKRSYAYRMMRFNFESLYWKDTQARLAQVDQPGPGYLHLPADTPEAWFRQFLSERKVVDRRRGKTGRSGRPAKIWKTRGENTPNHYWDCAILNCVLTDMQLLNLRSLTPAAARRHEATPAVERTGDRPIRTSY